MKRHRLFGPARALVLALLVSAGMNALAQKPSGTPDALLKPCRVNGLSHEVLCGVLRRPLDPRETARTIDVHFVVVPALARQSLDDPVFFLAGGPGQSAIDLAPSVMSLLGRVNNRRDIVFVDQRGTGRSAPLACADDELPFIEQASFERQLVRIAKCREALQRLPHGDLRHYATSVAVEDYDAVRHALGAARVNLVGGSYGTRVALEWMRRHPQAIRRAVLDGVAPADMVLPLSYSADGQAALDAALAACEAEPACVRRHRDVRRKWEALIGSLPRDVTIDDPLTGAPSPTRLTRPMLLQAVRAALYSPATASALPPAIDAAAAGRFEAMAGLGSLADTGRGAVALGMHFSVVCAEDVPLMASARIAPGRDFGMALAEIYSRICSEWPQAPVDPAFRQAPVAASAPATLLLSGGLDPVTPPRHGERVARALAPRARHVVVAHAGHGVVGLPCMRDVLSTFLETPEDADALAVDATCATGVPPPAAFVPIAAPAGHER